MGFIWMYVVLMVSMEMLDVCSSKECFTMEYVSLTSSEGGVPVPQDAMNVTSCVTWCSDVTTCQAVTYNNHSATCTVFDTLTTFTDINPCCQLYLKRASSCHNDTDSSRGTDRSTQSDTGTVNKKGIDTDRDKGTGSDSDSSKHKGLTPIELGTDFGDSNVLSVSAEIRLDDQDSGARLKGNSTSRSRSNSRSIEDKARSNSSHSHSSSSSAENQATNSFGNGTEVVSRSIVSKGQAMVNYTGGDSKLESPNLNEPPLLAKNRIPTDITNLRESSEEEHGSWSFDEDVTLTSEEILQRKLKVESQEPFGDFNHTSNHKGVFSQDITQRELQKMNVPDNADLEDLDMVTSISVNLDSDAVSLRPKSNVTETAGSASGLPVIINSPATSKADNSSGQVTMMVEVEDEVESVPVSVIEGVTPGTENSAETIIADAYCKQNVTIMQAQGRMNQPGGADIGRAISSQECQDWCLDNHYCVSVDYNMWDRSCWWHGMPGHTRNSTCCTHHVKLHTCTYDCFDIYHGYMLNISSESTLNVTLEECRALCTQDVNCTGFDFCNLTSSCRLLLEEITTTVSMRQESNSSLYAIKKDCYGTPQDVHIIIATTTILPTFPDFTFPFLPSTPPSNINDADDSTTDAHFLLSPAALIVLGGCSLVLTVGGATMVGYLLHRRREKRILRGDLTTHHHPAVWMNDYPAAHYATRGLSYWYADGPPGVMAVNPAFTQHDEFPVGRTSAEFGMGRGLPEGSNTRRQRTLSGGVSRSRSFGDSPYGIQHSSYPTFPLRQLRVSVPSTSGGSAPSPGNSPTTPSTHAHAHYPASYGEYHAGGHMDGRRLPRYELGVIHDDELRCAYP